MCERELETEQNCNILTPTLMAISVVFFSFSRAAQPHLVSSSPISKLILSPKLTDFLSSPSYIMVQSPTQYLPITGHQNVSLSPSLEWHVWSSSNGKKTVMQFTGHSLPVHQFVTVPWDFNPVPYCQPIPPTPMEYALPPSLEWHVWWGRWSISNTF